MVPDSCIDRGLSLAQWLKLIEETAAQPALKKLLKGKVHLHCYSIFLDFSLLKVLDDFWTSNDGPGL